MTKLLLIDEKDCFGLVKQAASNSSLAVDLLEPEYFLAPNPTFFSRMVTAAKQADVIILHRKIWTDECTTEDTCQRLNEFEKIIKPRPLLRVGDSETTHQSCPRELLSVYKQLEQAIAKFGSSPIGAKVKSPNPLWKSNLTIESLDIIGSSTIGCILQTEQGEKRKYYKLTELEPAT